MYFRIIYLENDYSGAFWFTLKCVDPELCSPLCVWVKNCEDLDLKEDDRRVLDEFINNLYMEIEHGIKSFHCYQKFFFWNLSRQLRCLDLFDTVESGGFLNNEGSALYPLQSACKNIYFYFVVISLAFLAVRRIPGLR